MEIYKISGTESSPDVYLDQNKGIFTLSGRSLPENAINVYLPIINWFDEYSQNPNPETVVEINFEYINSASIKQLAKLVVTLEKIKANGGQISVNWHFTPEDFDGKAYGEHLSRLVTFPIALIGDASK